MLAVASLALAACGADVQPRSTLYASSSGPTTNTQTTTGWAECLPFDASNTRLSGKVTTYYYNGTLQNDKVRVRISSLLAQFDTDTSYSIQMFRWKQPAGATQATIDSTPVEFSFEAGTGSSAPISSWLTSLKVTDLAAIRSKYNVSGSSSTDFFSQTTMVVRGLDLQWQALRVVLYQGTTAVGNADILLPAFEANPNVYAASHSSSVASIHPFISISSQTKTEDAWTALAKGYCF